MKVKKRVAILTIIIMLLNMLSPYSILFNNTVQAATGVIEENPVIFNNLGITTKGSNKILKIQMAIVSEQVIDGLDLKFKIDTSKITPCNKNTGATSSVINLVTTVSDYYMGTFQTKTYSSGTFRFTTTEPSGGTDILGNGYVPGEMGDPDYDDPGAGFSTYYPMITMFFKITDSTLTEDNLVLDDLFTLVPVTGSLPTGMKIAYQDASGLNISKDLSQIGGKGFATAEKTVTSIAVKTLPSNTTYEHGDTIDLTGGVITVTYDDNSTEDINMTDSDVNITTPATGKADINNKTITITYKNKTATIDLTVTDPIQSLAITKPMTDTEYDHGENFDFTGLELTATKKSGDKVILDSTSEGLSISENSADIDSSNFTQTSTSGVIPVSGTQKIIFTYEGKTATQTVVVNDTITGISLTSQPNKVIYKRGETLDLAGASVKLSLASGATANINLPDGSINVSTYSSTTTGTKQHLTVNFGTFVASDTIDVEAYDYITNANLITPTKTAYKYNESLEVTGGSLRISWKSGTMTTVSLTDSMVTGYNSTTLGKQVLTVTHSVNYTLSDGTTISDSIVKTFEVEVVNPVKSISITAPSKTEYNHGDSIDLTGGTIVVTYENNSTKNVAMTTAMITEADGSTTNMSPLDSEYTNYKLSKSLKIEYSEDSITEFISYPITIINKITGIAMHTTPKTSYNVNEGLDVTNGEILVTRQTGTPSVEEITAGMVSGFDASAENANLQLTVSYTENGTTKTTSYNVEVKDSVTSIEVKNAPTTVRYGDELDLSGTTIDVVKGSGNSSIPVTAGMLSGYDKNTLGMQTVTVTYGGKTDTFEVEVQDYVTDIILTKPTKVSYEYNETFELAGGKVQKVMASGATTTPVDLADSAVTVSTPNMTQLGTQTITVTYEGKSKTFDITITDEIASIAVKTNPNKMSYGYQENIELSGGELTVTSQSGATSTVNMTDSSVTITEVGGGSLDLNNITFGTDNKVSKTIQINYEGKSTTLDVEIINKITGIAMHTTPKTSYNVNESLDVTNGEILVTRQTGTPSVEEITEGMVSGFDSSAENANLQLTVSYTENGTTKTTSYNVEVKDSVTSIDVKNAPTTVKYGDELDLSGTTIDVVKGSGNSSIPVTAGMLSGYDKNTLGMQTVTVTYGGKTDTFEVEVQDYVTRIKVVPSSVEGIYGTTLADLIANKNIKYVVTYASNGDTTPVSLTEAMVNIYNPTSTSDQTLTVTYTDNDINSFTNGQSFTTNFNVKLVDNVNSISVTGTPTESLYGEELDLSGMTIAVSRDSGISTVPVTEATISGFNKNTLGPQTVTVEYGGQSTTFTVEVKDYIKDIILTAPTKDTYHWNTTGILDLTGGSVHTVMASGATGTPVGLDEPSVSLSAFVPNQEGTQTITVTFEGKQKTFDVTVIDEVYNIVVNDAPSSVDYGNSLDLTGTTITVTKDSGVTTIPVTADMLSSYDSTNLSGTQTITVTYEGKTDTFDILVNDYVVDFVLTAPSKTTYEYGESLDLSDAIITKITASGANTQTVSVTADMISGFDNTQLGAQTVTVTYEGKQKTFGVTVVDNIQSIAMATTPKTEYNYGEGLDVTGGTITVTRSSGTSTINITPAMVSGFNPNTVGPQTVTVTYAGQTTTYNVNVTDYVKEITIVYPNKVVYNLNEPLDLTGGQVSVIMASGTVRETVAMDATMVSGFDSSTTGAKTLTVSYAGKTAIFGITVVDQLAGMSIFDLPNKLDYLYGEGMDLTGGSIQITKESGETTTIPMDASMISGFTTTTLGQVLVTVNYEGLQDSFYINVTDYETGATLFAPNKTTYEYGEDLDLTGGLIKIMMASGAVKEQADLTASMITGFSNTTVGNQTLTVTYKGYTKTFSVTVKDTLGGIALNSEPNKTQYKYGENIDITGGTIKVIKTSGTTIENITSEMISGYNPNVSGYQVVTVTYQGFKTQFVVYVYPEVAPSTDDNTPTTDETPKSETVINNITIINNQTTPTPPRKTTSTVNKLENQPKEETEESTNEVVETPVEELPVVEETEEKTEEKPTITLGEKDEEGNQPEIDNKEKLAKFMLLIALIVLLLLLISRKNTKIYVEEDGEFVLGGKQKLNKDEPEIDINEYLDGETYNGKVKIVLNDSISEKLAGKEITIKHRDKIIKVKIKYDDEPVEINLE